MRSQQQNQRRTWIWVSLAIVLVVAGILIGVFLGREGNSSKTSAPATSQRRSTSASSVTSQKNSASSESSTAESSSPSSTESVTAGPYSVSTEELNAIRTWDFHGVNVPRSVNLSFNDDSGAGTITIVGAGGGSFGATYVEIPTKTIRVFSASTNAIRSVKVNSELQFNATTADTLSSAGSLYAFKNKQGGISLATPNYAGNVTNDEMDVMIELTN